MSAHTLPLAAPAAGPQVKRPLPPPKNLPKAPRGANWLSEALLEMSPTRPQRRTVDVFLSVGLHVAILSALVLVPLYFTDTLDIRGFTQTLLVAPPPPPPPPPPAPAVVRTAPSPKRIFSSGKLIAPTTIPQKVVIIKEEAPPEMGIGVVGGVLGGVPGGQAGGVIGGIISSARTTPPPAPNTAHRAPVRVGGHVKEPRLTYRLEPDYPVLARQAHITGEVVINAIIDEQGNVIEMRVLSGPVLLIDSATRAVRLWKYEPSRLNGEPISVELVVRVMFRLS